MATIQELINLSDEIRTNTAAASNTNELVGSTMKGIAEHVEDLESGAADRATSGYRIAGFIAPGNSYEAKAVENTCYIVLNNTGRSWYVPSGQSQGAQGVCYMPPAGYTPSGSVPSSVTGWTPFNLLEARFNGRVVIIGYRNGAWTAHQQEAPTKTYVDAVLNSLTIIESPESDLDFADKNGYIIMRIVGGHVKTKNFDSSTIKSTIEKIVEEKIVDDQPIDIANDLSDADMRIVDDDGHILAEFSGGHFKTKNFNSWQGRKGFQDVTRFQLQVECGNPIPTAWLTPTNINDYTPKKVFADNVVLKLPTTYTTSGASTKLIIYCKHGGSQITETSDPVNQYVFPYLLHLGYAILACDGMPDGLTAELHLDDTRVVGNYAAVASVRAAYDYVVENYNLEKDGAYIWGYSQGGMYAQNVIDLSGINFFACAEVAPVCSMRYHQWDLAKNVTIDGVTFSKAARLNIARLFGFPSVSTNAELLALEYNQDRLQGYDPWTRNVENPYAGFIQNGSLWYLPNGVDVSGIAMKKHLKCPLKIWVANDDTTLSPDVTKVFVQAIKNAGQVADMHIYSSGGHSLFNKFTAIGTFTQNGAAQNLYPLALEVAIWFSRFGGYNVDF